MSIPLTGTGGLFTRLGLIFGLARNLWGFVGKTSPSPSSDWGASGPTIDAAQVACNLIAAQYQSTLQSSIDTLYQQLSSFQTSAPQQFVTYLQSLAQNTLITMANDDTPLPAGSNQLTASMSLLISQMTSGTQTVQDCTVSATVAAGSSNHGNAHVVATCLQATGKSGEYVYAEAMTATVTNDEWNGATAGQEPLSVVGTNADSSGMLDWQWPLGSGATQTTSVVDPTQSASGGNLLTNSAWTNWTGSVPNNWTITAGGTIVSKGTTNLYGAATADLEIAGDGATTVNIYQPFASTTGTSSILTPNTQYAVSAVILLSASAVAGVLELVLTDGSGTIVNDDQGNPNTISVTLTGQTSQTNIGGFFRTPSITPSTGYKFGVLLSTALTSGKNLFVNYLAMTEAQQLYADGPYVGVFRGSTDVAIGDAWTITIANNYAGQFQTCFNRFFNMVSLGMQLPSGGSPTIAETLITC